MGASKMIVTDLKDSFHPYPKVSDKRQKVPAKIKGKKHKQTKATEISKKHLKGIYGANWNIEKLIYKKY